MAGLTSVSDRGDDAPMLSSGYMLSINMDNARRYFHLHDEQKIRKTVELFWDVMPAYVVNLVPYVIIEEP